MMKKGCLLASLVFAAPAVFVPAAFAACPSLEGNWLMQTTLTTPYLDAGGLVMSSGISHINITGGTITFISGFNVDLAGNDSQSGTANGRRIYSIDGSDNVSSVSRLESGSGIASMNPANCRAALSWNATYTVFTQNGNRTLSFSGRARGDYVKMTKGFAGRVINAANTAGAKGTFEMSPD